MYQLSSCFAYLLSQLTFNKIHWKNILELIIKPVENFLLKEEKYSKTYKKL